MHYAGIDIGSRSIELVVVDETMEVVNSLQTDTGFDPMANAGTLLGQASYDFITATGYGRTLFEIEHEAQTVTEIKAHARGYSHSFLRYVAYSILEDRTARLLHYPEQARLSNSR